MLAAATNMNMRVLKRSECSPRRAGFNDYLRQYRELVKSTFKRPAIFGYMIGNEIFDEVTQNPQFWLTYSFPFA